MKGRKLEIPPHPPLTKGGKRGIFISFEGIEGTGKSTQAKLLHERLMSEGYEVVLTQEPGGTEIGRKIRKILLHLDHKEMSLLTELLLYNADRAQHIHEAIIPALSEGKIVITDRFSDSTIAYQGYGRGIDINLLKSLDRIATEGLKPHLTILFDLEVETGLMRNRGIKKTDRLADIDTFQLSFHWGVNKIDRLELEDVRFHKRVRKGYLRLAAMEPERIKLIKASKGIEEIHREIVRIVEKVLR